MLYASKYSNIQVIKNIEEVCGYIIPQNGYYFVTL